MEEAQIKLRPFDSGKQTDRQAYGRRTSRQIETTDKHRQEQLKTNLTQKICLYIFQQIFSGVDYENLKTDLEEHRKYFREVTSHEIY